MASWVVAIGAVAAWNWYENKKNTSLTFSSDEQDLWNKEKKLEAANKK